MRSWLALQSKRFLAFAADVACLGALSALVIWWDDHAGVLYAYNSELLGNCVVFIWFVIPEVVWSATLGKHLLRLELVSADGRAPRRAQLALRSFLFWLAVMAPSTFAPRLGALSWLLDQRQQWIVLLAFSFTLMLLPMASSMLSATGIGVHDYLTNVQVQRTARAASIQTSALPAFNLKWSPRLYATGCALFVVLVALGLSVDWTFNVEPAFKSTMRVNKRYFETALAESDRNTAFYATLTASLTDSYVTSSPHLVLPGLTQHYAVPASPSLLADHEKAIEYAREFANEQLRFGVPSGVQWIVIELMRISE